MSKYFRLFFFFYVCLLFGCVSEEEEYVLFLMKIFKHHTMLVMKNRIGATHTKRNIRARKLISTSTLILQMLI